MRWVGRFAVVWMFLFSAVLTGCSSDSGNNDNNPMDSGDTGGGAGYTVSGKITMDDGNPLYGIVVGLVNDTDQLSGATDADGNYGITGVPDGSYVLTPADPDFSFEPPYRVVTVNGAGAGGLNFTGTPVSSGDGTPETITITVGDGLTPTISWDGGNVDDIIVMEVGTTGTDFQWRISSAMGTVNAIASPVVYGTTPQGATEDANEPLEAGNSYRVTISRWSSEGDIIGYTTFDTGGGDSGESHIVSGKVIDQSQSPIADATIVFADNAGAKLPRTATTDADGMYSFNNVIDGIYLVTVTHPSYVFLPDPVHQVMVSGQDAMVEDFIGQLTTVP